MGRNLLLFPSMKSATKTGVLLLNLGSPEAPTASAVRTYLAALLGDPRVLEMPAPLRWLLLHGIILRTRPKFAAHAYSQIWTAEGSPLLVHTKAFVAGLAKQLGEEYVVEFAMSCGEPFIPGVVEKLLRLPLKELVIVPLYPQYASATVGSSVEAVMKALSTHRNIPQLRTVSAFFDHPDYLNAVVETSAPILESLKPDHVLFSYHGLPESQIRKGETTTGHCLSSNDSCCAEFGSKNFFCYRAQCFATTRSLVARLGLAPDAYSMSFQSRLGRTPWIQPYTEEMLVSLAKKGVRHLAVLTPSFVADCLETLEEIGIRASETFIAAGGERLDLIPALNSSESWTRAAAKIIQNR